MFTGLVQYLGTVQKLAPLGSGRRLTIEAGPLVEKVAIGSSVCVSGCCLTVVAISGTSLDFEAGPETLLRTTFGSLQVGDRVNLELSLRLGDEIGGHLVTGHIDGRGKLVRREDDGEWSTFWFSASLELMRQMASKGSIAVDGVSLTLVEVTDSQFSVALIPHTLAVTNLGGLQPGAEVHLETDLLAKYVARQLVGLVRS